MEELEIEYFGPKNSPIIGIIRNFYNTEELQKIWREISFLTSNEKLLSGDKTSSAKNENNSVKKNHGIFLDAVYSDRSVSDILTCTKKIFSPEILGELDKINSIFGYLKESNSDLTLLSYYQNNDSYFSHKDKFTFTVLNYFFREPKKFKGGDLRLEQFDLTIKIENNMVIYMPSCYLHEATKVEMDENDYFSGNGRYCISKFVSILPGV